MKDQAAAVVILQDALDALSLSILGMRSSGSGHDEGPFGTR